MKTFIELIRCLPEIIKLIEAIQKRIEQNKLEKKIHDDLTKITEAFKNEDEKALKDIFSS